MIGAGFEFMEKTKYRYLGPSQQQRGDPQPPLQALLAEGSSIPLPAVADIAGSGMGLRDAIERRRSLREYAETPLTLEELSFLLWSTQGVRETLAERATFRTVPSAGARHPFETAVLANRIDGLAVGLHQYDALEHRMIEMSSPPDALDRLTAACHGQEIVRRCAAVFVWVADSVRMTWRYGERGFRYMHLDAGHVCQNLYLAAESIGAGACAIGAFEDDEVNRLLGLESPERFAIYIATVGKRSLGG